MGKLMHAARQWNHHVPRDERCGNAHHTPSQGVPCVAGGQYMRGKPFDHMALLKALFSSERSRDIAANRINASGGFVLKRMTVGAAPKSVTISATRVTWEAVDSATRYDVWINYIDEYGKAERILRQDAFGTERPLSSSLTTRSGEYRVWIRAIRNEAGQEYTGRWSEHKTLQVNSSLPDSSALEIIMSELAISGVLDVVAST